MSVNAFSDTCTISFQSCVKMQLIKALIYSWRSSSEKTAVKKVSDHSDVHMFGSSFEESSLWEAASNF